MKPRTDFTPFAASIGKHADKPGRGYRAPSKWVRFCRLVRRLWAALWRWLVK